MYSLLIRFAPPQSSGHGTPLRGILVQDCIVIFATKEHASFECKANSFLSRLIEAFLTLLTFMYSSELSFN